VGIVTPLRVRELESGALMIAAVEVSSGSTPFYART
jgi:hypothetical protein